MRVSLLFAALAFGIAGYVTVIPASARGEAWDIPAIACTRHVHSASHPRPGET